MRYQIRLLDQNLPGLAREVAQACWHATDGVVQKTLGNALYRDLYRGVRDVFRKHVQAFRYCNAASVCERRIPQTVAVHFPRHEQFAGEHVHVYLMSPEVPLSQFVTELVQATLERVVGQFPVQPLPELPDRLQHVIHKILDQRVFRSERCGDDNLCHANEAYDPWDLRDPINKIRSTAS